MQVHPEFDIETKTWFVEEFEAPSIRALVNTLRQHYNTTISVKDYFPANKASPRIAYETSDKMRPTRPTMVVGVVRQDNGKPRTVTYKTKNKVGGLKDGRGAAELSEDERKQVYESVLNLWAEGNTIRQIAAILNLKYNYVGSNILPKARQIGDSRAAVRNKHLYGLPKT